MKYTQNGAFNLKKLELQFDDGIYVNLIPLFIDATIYESIYGVAISGNISIMDTTSLYNENFLGNGERVRIVFETAGSDNQIDVTGVVYKCSPPTRVNEHTSGLVLFFTSEEIINNKRTIVERAFNDTCSNIVKELHKTISDKPISSVPSKELHHFVGAKQNPIDVIGMLARRSVSQSDEYGYMYFENNKQFVFLPLEYLLRQPSVAFYQYKNAGVFQDVKKKEEEAFASIQDYSINEVPNLITQTNDGVLGSQTINLNIREKSFFKTKYDNESKFRKNIALGRVPNLDKSLINEDYTDKLYSFVSDNEKPLQNYRHRNMNTILNIERYSARISVFGDSNLTCGSVITCNLPVWGKDANKGQAPDPFSGDFLVAEIKHTLKSKQYMQTMKLIKDSFEVGK